jgi:bifunctional non-homologous end joining protein LigD
MANDRTVRGVEISKPDKELITGRSGSSPVTKHALAQYYSSVADVMLPYLRDRPINMQRFPDGNGARALVYVANQACVTPHTWLSRTATLDRPDQLVFDLDPSRDDVSEVRRAALLTRDVLDDLGLTSYVKTTGSRGYHAVVPLRPGDDFDAVREFARDVAEHLAGRDPDLLTVEQRKDKRGDRVYVDVMRNGYGQTAVPPFAVRARPGAPVSTPIVWDEVEDVEPDQFTVANLADRLAKTEDPWRGFRRHAQGLGKARKTLARLR